MHHFSNSFKGKRTPIHGQKGPTEEAIVDPEVKFLVDQDDKVAEDKYESDVCAPMTMTELNCILNKLPNEKSSGVDLIPNEFLKNCGSIFKKYLLIFYNKIIEEGRVPSALNVGKCCLIWKVRLCV